MNFVSIMTAGLALSVAPAPVMADNNVIGKCTQAPESTRFTPADLWAMGRVGSVVCSPAGDRIAYVVRYYSVEKNKSHATLYIMNADGSGNTCLTRTADNESDPAFIDGGHRLAFLSNAGGSSQVWSMNLDGSERRQLSFCDKDVEGFQFSPDEAHIALIHQVASTTSIEAKPEDLPLTTGLVINDLNYKHWDHYVTEIPHLFVAPFDGQRVGASKDVLEGEPYECPTLPFGGMEQIAWSPDGKRIAYSSRKKTGVDYVTSTDTDIYEYELESGKTINLCKPDGYKEPERDNTRSLEQQAPNRQTTDCNMGYDNQPQYSPDGRYIAWTSMERDGYESDRTRLCVLDRATGSKTYVTEQFESGVDDYCWNSDSRSIYFIGVWEGTTMVYSTNLKGEVKKLTDGDYDYASVALCGKDIVSMRHSMSAPDDIYRITLPTRKKAVQVARLTNENQVFTDKLDFGEVKERWVNTKDGKREKCWVIYPPAFDPAKKYPTLLFCEGGPQSPVSQFWSYRWNFQVMAARDYIIIAPNRRGLPGFGMEWLEAISGDYSGQCMQDYLDAIDDLCNEPYVDKERLGCVGASFGGYSVYWLAGNHDKRFKCFIAHDGIFNTQQQYVETEEMWFPNWDLGAAPWRKGITADTTEEQVADAPGKSNAYTTSPHLYVDKWDTPILCIHGEKDYRILSSQGQSAFNAARMRGIPAQLLLFPDENHWVLRPQNGMLWQRTFLGWLDKWLKK
ncbi:MAG: S9 family peptidase [Clostridium sp.]|nr:S9 family peptidase [Clostridium sp.]